MEELLERIEHFSFIFGRLLLGKGDFEVVDRCFFTLPVTVPESQIKGQALVAVGSQLDRFLLLPRCLPCVCCLGVFLSRLECALGQSRLGDDGLPHLSDWGGLFFDWCLVGCLRSHD